MREFLKKMMSDDESQQNFTKKEIVVYGIIVPLGLVLLMALVGWMESCM